MDSGPAGDECFFVLIAEKNGSLKPEKTKTTRREKQTTFGNGLAGIHRTRVPKLEVYLQ